MRLAALELRAYVLYMRGAAASKGRGERCSAMEAAPHVPPCSQRGMGLSVCAPAAQLATPELRANVLAAYVAGGRSREVPAVMAAMKFGARDGFEVAFNAACALLGAGDAPAAEQQLLLAQRLGA